MGRNLQQLVLLSAAQGATYGAQPIAAGFTFGGPGRNLWGATYGAQPARLRPIYARRLGRPSGELSYDS